MTVDGTPAPETPSTPEAAAGLLPCRILPALWMPVAPTLAWLAFGSAETDLDAAYYFGASIWHAAEPDRIVEWLSEIKDSGDLPGGNWSEDFVYIHQFFIDKVIEIASPEALGNAKADGIIKMPEVNEAHFKQGATELLEELQAHLPIAKSQHTSFWNASETLRRAIANGEVRAFGHLGDVFDYDDQDEPLPLRERIPDALFAAPVTVTQRGLLSFARGDDSYGNHNVLWSDLLFDSAEILKIKPEPADGSPSTSYKRVAPDLAVDRGGRNPEHDWAPFLDECCRYLQEGGHDPADEIAKRKVRAHMRWWAKRSMEPTPDPKTIHTKTKTIFEAAIATAQGKSGLNRA